MNAQKEVTLVQLRARFSRQFDNMGKMDPYLQFVVGKCVGRTETATGAGKEPVWKDAVVLTYFDETNITVRGYDEDISERECVGWGKLQIKSLRFPGGAIELALVSDTGEAIGTVTGKYTIKNLNQHPLLLLKNFKVETVKEEKALLKSRPFLQFASDQATSATEAKEEVKGNVVTWGEGLRLRIKQNSKLTVSLVDKEDTLNNIFRYGCTAKEFRLQSGSKKWNILDKAYNLLGWLSFDYETVNLVSKEESVKGVEREKKAEGQLTAINIERISTQFKQEGLDIFYRFIIGANSLTTEVLKNCQKLTATQLRRTLYAQAKENRLTVVVSTRGAIGDQIIGAGYISLEGLYGGQKRVILVAEEGKEEVATATLSVTFKQAACRVLALDSIVATMAEDGDLIGESQPFVLAQVGSCVGRTETGEQSKVTFKRGIELKFCQEESLDLEIWDEDVAASELLYKEQVKLSQLKGKGDYQVNFTRAATEVKPESKAKVTFRYEMKSHVALSETARKHSEKKSTELHKTAREVHQSPSHREPGTEREKGHVEVEGSKKKQSQLSHPTEEYQPSQHTESGRPNLSKEEANQSRQTLVLPSIMGGHKVFGDRIFEKQSAATLQKTIVAYSMPKANRFSNQPKYSGEPAYCLDSCFKNSSSRGVGFGFGGKRQFPDWMERNMKENPPPGAYFDGQHDLRSRGPTFGLSHKYYEKVIIPKEKGSGPTVQTVRKLSPIPTTK